MSKLESSVLDVRRGSHRMNVAWLSPAGSHEHDDQFLQRDPFVQHDRIAQSPQQPHPAGVPASAGKWVERAPGTFARHQVAIPVTVGSHLR